MDAIHLEDLSFFGFHGLYEEEAKLGQRFIVDLTCWADLGEACISDRYEDTICYGTLAKTVEEVVTKTRFHLIERLAAAICEAVFQQDTKIQRIRVRLRKPSAPVPVHSGHFSVEITRDRVDMPSPAKLTGMRQLTSD
ncbi:dihydroneopterin aldolase [Pseudovibrio exalbescens]|uniref:7,8-dihydroneopterin aldolase n=1 Tax=Pseudovibrio exalbescens TaxID=197461 RepID=A0A1U7JDN7_9HYPH|nr:dihydroneopterin aldolase [Pseudovibrio exalbescens]OKL42808.1 dihydroneopterin aldolase [Pseudovibrio exalbescens]